ncbi:MAG: UPF0149 family protein [Thiomargarita sp.]|nr:UPF0149 family protein [Thiomargarita sp.]
MQELYEPINKSLEHVGALMSAAEAHGILCGLLCSQSFSQVNWLTHVLGEISVQDGLAYKCEEQLLLVKNYTLEQLNSIDCEFMPLLPEDEIALKDRTQALGGWCEGFLFGIGMAHSKIDSFTNDSKEFVNDMIAISKIELSENSDNLEENYMQVVEYIKIGIINLYEESNINE